MSVHWYGLKNKANVGKQKGRIIRENYKAFCYDRLTKLNTFIQVSMKLVSFRRGLVSPLLLSEIVCTYGTCPHGDTVDHDIWTLFQEAQDSSQKHRMRMMMFLSALLQRDAERERRGRKTFSSWLIKIKENGLVYFTLNMTEWREDGLRFMPLSGWI